MSLYQTVFDFLRHVPQGVGVVFKNIDGISEADFARYVIVKYGWGFVGEADENIVYITLAAPENVTGDEYRMFD